MEKFRIVIYHRDGSYFFVPTCGALAISPVRIISASSSPIQIGESALDALADCRAVGTVPWPKNWDREEARHLKDLRIGSWNEFVVGCHSISFSCDGVRFISTPLRTDPTTASFMGLNIKQDESFPFTNSKQKIGDSIISAFHRCVTESSIPQEDPEDGHF